MQARQWRGPLSTKPYILFERYFASSSEHLERFQNFVAGNGILVDLLSANWFEYLPIKERVPVTSLFRRIYQAENVWLSYRNRPAIVERTSTLENVDQDSLPKSVFIVPVRSVGGGMAIWLKVTKLFSSIGSALESSLRQVLRGADFVASYLTLGIVAIPLAIISILSFASPNLQAAITRIKIKLLAEFRPQSSHIGRHLSRYETLHAGNSAHAVKMAGMLKKPSLRRLLTEENIDNLAFKDRVLVTSLLRRTANADPEVAYLLKSKNLSEAVEVKSQRFVAQLTRPGAQQKEEWKSFKKLNTGQKHKHARKTAQANVSQAVPAARPPRARAVPSSESVLQQHGWFLPANKSDMAFATILRERAFNDAADHLNKAEVFAALSPQMKTKAGAIMALLQQPFTHQAAPAEIDQNLLIPVKISNRSSQSQAEVAFSAALPYLYPEYEGEAARSPLACWTNLQDALADDTEFSYAAEVLTAAYSGTPYNRVTDRTVSFDTYLITQLEEILDKIRLWVDWDDCPTSALVAYAYAAATVGDRAHFDFFVTTLEGRSGIPPRFAINLRDSYFNSGIHKLDAILSPSNQGDEESQLRKFEKNKKYLCLVEMGARVQALRQIEGITDNLLCGPVAPTDAVKFPQAASFVQAEDFIPMYSAEDMKIGAEVDRLTEHYLDNARRTLKTSGVSELYEDAIEVTHATIYFALYRDAISAVICEKMIASAADYDGVILLTKTGQILGNMIAPAIEAVGRENVYLSLGSHRTPEFFSALTKMRAAAKSVKPKPIVSEPSDDWMSSMGGWISESMNFHGREMQNVKSGPYSIMTLEHINGYFDSYQALIRQGLPHSNVELFTSAANTQLNDHIVEGGFTPYESAHELRHCVMRPRTPDARPWVTPFAKTLRNSFEDYESPYLPHYRDMILERAQAVFSQRLPQIMDAVSYFRARFALGLPDYVFTGPNQHMISRAAAYCAKASGVPVYDFLILANTNHPRYRPIVADYAYLYDPWYKEIYQSFFGMKEEQLRTAGPLFEYSERLKQAPNLDYAAPRGKTHIVFFSQSANFDNSKLMLESICQATKDRKDIYITVKLHPHESPANIERYTQIAAENGVKGNIYVFHKGDAVALLNQADLVVQSFSNIGLDALLLKKPVITFKPKTDLKARIFLYEKDIGYVVSTKRTLTNKIKKFLKDPKDRAAMNAIAEKFAVENDHFLRGENAARVMNSVQEDVIRFKTAREN